MSDVADKANDRIEAENALRDKIRKDFKPSVSENCYECDTYIPMARQEAVGGTDMCIDCQADYEYKRKNFL